MDKFLTYYQAKEKVKYFAKTNNLKIKEEVLIDNRAHKVINRSSLPTKEIYNLRKQDRRQVVYYLAVKGYSVVLIFNLKETEEKEPKEEPVYKQLSFEFK